MISVANGFEEKLNAVRLQKGDVLEICIASDDVDTYVVSRVKKQYQQLIEKMHGPDFASVVVFGVAAGDNVTSVVKKGNP